VRLAAPPIKRPNALSLPGLTRLRPEA